MTAYHLPIGPRLRYGNSPRLLHCTAALAALVFAVQAAAQSAPASSAPREEKAVVLEEFVVTGYRASLAASLDEKRKANAIVDVISAQDIGKFPDTNVAESLAHLPGVTVDRLFGEGEQVSVNGTDPNLTRTLLNGQTVASGDWFILDAPSRKFNYSLLAPESIGRAEVYKTPEARLPEGSIGATIILHTRNPLTEKKDTAVSATIGDNYNDRAKAHGHVASLVASWRNPQKTFGVLLGLQNSREHFQRHGVEALGYTTLADQTAATGAPAPAGSLNRTNPTAVQPNAINVPLFDQVRNRRGGNLAVVAQPNSMVRVEFNALVSKAINDNANHSYYPFPGWGGGGGITTTGTVVNGVVDTATITNNIAVEDLFYRKATIKTESYDGKLTLTPNAAWTFTGQAGYTKATGGTQRQFYIEPAVGAGYSYTGGLRNPGFSWTDRTLATDPKKWTLGGAWWNGNVASAPEKDDEKYAQVDAAFKVSGTHKLSGGVRYTDHNTSQNWYILTVNTLPFTDLSAFGGRLTPSSFGAGLANLTPDMRSHVIVDPSRVGSIVANLPYLPAGVTLPASYYSGPIGGAATASNGQTTAQLRTMEQAVAAGEGFQPAQSFAINEKVSGAYLQDSFQFGEWSGNVGVRFARTETESTGSLIVGTAVTPLVVKSSYNNFLPAFNLAYAASNNAIARLGLSQVIARPNFADESSSLNLFNSILQGNGGNPGLKPYKATNVDLSYEWYFAKNSVLGINPFYRDIKDYVLSVAGAERHFNQATNRVDTFNISRPRNAGSAKSKGFSLYLQQELGGGFGLSANYTYTDAKNAALGQELPYASKNQINISPFYENKHFLARLTYAWRSDYFTGVNRGALNYTDDYAQLDANIAVNFLRNYQFTFAVTNLLDERYGSYAKNVPGVTGEFFQGQYKNGRRFQTALRVNF